MKTFKIADMAGQVLILTVGLLYLTLFNKLEQFIYLYYVMGTWQFCSFLIHSRMHDSWVARKDRRHYGKVLVWILIAILISALFLLLQQPVLIVTMGALLFISPVLAIWYFLISVEEWRSIKRKELIHLK